MSCLRRIFWSLLALAPLCVPAQEELRPKHITSEALRSVQQGLDYLAKSQLQDGSFQSTSDGATYPISMTSLAGMAFLANGNTTSRGPYADNVRRAVRFVLKHSSPSGLIVGPGGENGRPMYGHGFALLFLSCAYGMETDRDIREQIAEVVEGAIRLTGNGQSPLGGWTYTPGGGDEGSVTVTQMQGLRAAHNAGFTVPKAVIQKAIRYLELCQTPEGGIRYAYHSSNNTRLPISAAAIACLYSAGEYESELAETCLAYVHDQFSRSQTGVIHSGHDFYMHLYAAQAFYQAGDEYWDGYFPSMRDHLVNTQANNGAWSQSYVGPVFGTSVALVILQLPYKFLPIYQR